MIDETFQRDLRRFKRLTPDQERALLIRCADGDLEARNELVERNMGLVCRIAQRFRYPGYDPADLVQIGVIGLIRGLARFDPERGVRLSTYVAWWIRREFSDLQREAERRPPPTPQSDIRAVDTREMEPPAAAIFNEQRHAVEVFMRGLYLTQRLLWEPPASVCREAVAV